MPPTSPNPYAPPKHHFNWWLPAFVAMLLFFLGAAAFAAWAYSSRADYKNNSDQKAAVAVTNAQKATSDAKDAEFAEKEKSPLKAYSGPSAYGSVVVQYPKTWSAYVIEATTTNSSIPVDGYFHPGFVPNTQSQGFGFALRVQVTATSYDTELKKFDSFVKQGKATVSPFKAAKVPSVAGARVDGQIDQNKTGSVVLLPLRDKTLKVSTEAAQYLNDFNTIILPNLTFVP